jgi:hypothetical protein
LQTVYAAQMDLFYRYEASKTAKKREKHTRSKSFSFAR